MSEGGKTIITSILTTVLVMGSAAPAAYYGLPLLAAKMPSGAASSEAVIMDLKAETVAEIRAVKSAAVEEMQALRTEVSAELKEAAGRAQGAANSTGDDTAVLMELKAAVETLHAGQKSLAERLMKAVEMKPAAMAKPPVTIEAAMPMAKDAGTVYFLKGKSRGAVIDTQVTEIAAGLKGRMGERNCPLRVTGYSDTLGSDAANLSLSKKRANYVAGKLKAQGFTVSAVHGWGERRLKVHTLDGAANRENRRVTVEMACSVPTA